MKNKILYMIYIDRSLFKDGIILELDGKNMQTKEQFFLEVEKGFSFPRPCEGSLDRFLDWMCDLDWIRSDKIYLIIKNAAFFLENDKQFKEVIFKCFEEDILPFWEKEVETVIVGGKPKVFNVYLQN